VAVVAVAGVSVATMTVAVVAMVIVAVVVLVACAADCGFCVHQGSPSTDFRTDFGDALCNINRPARETHFCQKCPRSLVPR
jgi:hypothetical protein